MKPAVVAQDEMFPDGDAGWMEMDEVLNDFNLRSCLLQENLYVVYCCSSFPVLFPCSSLLGCIRRWNAD